MAPSLAEQIASLASGATGLELLVLYGSRARGDATERSDWDFGFIADASFDAAALYAKLVLLLKTDAVDLVDLATAGSVLRVRAASDGKPLYAAKSGSFEDFWFKAVSFWLDMGPLIQAEQARLVAETAK